MSRSAALRASLVFLVATLMAGTLGAASGSVMLQAFVAVLASVAALTGTLAALGPASQPVPGRVRSNRRLNRERL
jgi:hypothetical protein